MKFTAAFLASLVVTASAFAPHALSTTRTATSTQLQADLWGKPPGEDKEMSKALPFVPRPKLLDGSLPGDVGFEYVKKSG